MHGAQPDKPVAPLRTSLLRARLALGVIGCGLSLRWYGFPLGLPAFVVKYGGSLLGATMVLLLVGALLPRLPRSQLASIAAVIATVVEFSRLLHARWAEAERAADAANAEAQLAGEEVAAIQTAIADAQAVHERANLAQAGKYTRRLPQCNSQPDLYPAQFCPPTVSKARFDRPRRHRHPR